MSLPTLTNPLASISQLQESSSRLDGVPAELEDSIRFTGCLLTQAAGVLLRLPQDIIAQAIVTFSRFFVGADGGSFRVHSAVDISASAIYLVSKLSAEPRSPRSILNVYAYLASPDSVFMKSTSSARPDDEAFYITEGTYLARRQKLYENESLIMRTLSYTTHFVSPHHLALTYLQTLSLLPPHPKPKSQKLASRTIAHLNTALLSPQLLALTHQPHCLAVAAIYLAAREEEIPISRTNWWEVFDVDREELGFLVVALRSMATWTERFGKVRAPLTPEELELELEAQRRSVSKVEES